MELASHYKTITNNSPFNLRQYLTPSLHIDPRKQVLNRKFSDWKNRPRQGKFKATCKHKPSFMDEHIKPLLSTPSPDKYKMKEGFDLSKIRQKSESLKKSEKTIGRKTFIDNIELSQKKFKHPGVGKYDLLKRPFPDKHVNLKPKNPPIKFHKLDDVKTVGAAIPGPGNYNPHKSVKRLRLNITDHKFFKGKHEEEEKKLKRSVSTKLGPGTYSPVKSNTFEFFSLKKGKERSRWSHGEIDIRKGIRSQMKSPSPAQYRLINQWSSKDPNQRQTTLGKVKLFERTTQSTRAFSLYH